MVDGKAQLLRDDYCDGLGDCLPACPTGAISFEEREALEYKPPETLPCGCPGTYARAIDRKEASVSLSPVHRSLFPVCGSGPVQTKLGPMEVLCCGGIGGSKEKN